MNLRPETVEFLKGLAYRPGAGTLRRGSAQRRPYMGRSRLYANRVHGGYAKSWSDRARLAAAPRAATRNPFVKARVAGAVEHVKRMIAGYEQHSGALKRKMELISRIHADAPHMLQHTPRIHDEVQNHIRSAQSYARLAGVRKDLDAGDAHISTAVGNSIKRSRQAKKYPPLSFAYGSTAP